MQVDSFAKLEEKIIQAMELIDRLKKENEEISSSYKKLSDEIDDFKTTTTNLTLETEKLRYELAHRERDITQRKAEIRGRVEKLMERLVPFADPS
ncbi:MAG: hypothetical protein WCE90_05675 [Candidatus Zixiibacteriota bacterium]